MKIKFVVRNIAKTKVFYYAKPETRIL